MNFGPDLGVLTILTDTLVFVFIAFAVPILRSLGKGNVVLILLPVVVWGVMWSFVPDLVTLRRETRFGLPISIFGSLIYLQIALRDFGRTGQDGTQILRLAGWRVAFGLLLGVLGLLGGLPAEFYISAALGDIVVGLLGLILLTSTKTTPRRVFLWNIIGLIDLTQVLALGAIYLVPFFTENPKIPLFGMLPIVGVPLFIALHVVALRAQRLVPAFSLTTLKGKSDA